MKCPFCDTDNQPGDDFCVNCGGYLASTPTSTTVPAGSGHVAATPGVGVSKTNAASTQGRGGSVTSGTLVPNARLQGGRYVVEKVLGEGGMGTAVLAKDTRVSNKRVVIKELISNSSDPVQHQEDVRNFEREVETLATLDHPLIPTVTDSFQENARYFMVQEYAAGENLEDYIERLKRPLPEQEVLLYASQVLDILEYLEEQTPPIVHRDIKPANIIVGSKDKRARLVDFGIARAQANKNAKRQQTSALGTPGYAPPEQYQGNADGRSDLYALGATIHHLLTNRDPRDYSPFAYPPVRTLNPQLSPEIERVLERALKINVKERYQHASEMKRDIDDILINRFQVTGPMTITSGAIPISRPLPTPGVAAQAGRSGSIPFPQQQSTGSVPYPQQAGMYARPPAPSGQGKPFLRNFLLVVFVLLLLGGISFTVLRTLSSSKPGPGSEPQTITPAPSSVSGNGLGVTQVGNEQIGISDGSYALDTERTDKNLKEQGTQEFKQGNTTGALATWRQAVSQDPNDAETLIYLENLSIANSPHVTFVVGAMPSGERSIVGVSRDVLQGAYVAQKEFNDSSKLPNGLKVRLLIASSGGQAKNATAVANQIVQLAKSDKTFAGVMGWPYSSLTYPVVSVLSQAKIPMVSSTSSDDGLTGTSPYFFRVVPPNKAQGIAGAQYARTTLQAKNVVLFADPNDPYSQSLGNDFAQNFKNMGGNVVATENYTVGQANTVQAGVQDALSKNPDLIYFSGLANDVNPLILALKSANAPSSLGVLGGDALYQLGSYQGGFGNRLRFTTFAYPDEWDILGLGAQKPAFFKDYVSAYSPDNQHTGYGFTRPTNDTMLAYDATYALLQAYSTASAGKTTVTLDDVRNALSTTSFQGVSGWIQFGPNGDPVDKALVILYVQDGFIHMDKAVNKFKG